MRAERTAEVALRRSDGRGQRGTTVVSVAVLLSLAASLVYAAVTSEGNRATQVDLHDNGIWLTRADTGSFGRLNAEIEVVDARLELREPGMELSQSGADVLLRTGDQLRSVDVVVPKLRPPTTLPPGASFGLGGDTAAVLDPATGELWTGTGTVIGTQEYEDDSLLVVEGADEVVVGVEGSVHVLDRDTGTVSAVRDDGSIDAQLSVGELDPATAMTVVGDVPVLLDGDRVITPGGESSLPPGTVALLQQPGPADDAVLVATDDALLEVPLGGGEPVVVAEGASGGPVEPVRVAGCAYGAWTTRILVAQQCGTADAQVASPPELRDGSGLRFRVNRNRVALNVLDDGGALIFVDGELRFVNDWSQALSEEEDTEESTDETAETVEEAPECDTGANQPPVANPNEAVTRQGQPVVIRAVDDDEDANCDVLTVVLDDELPDEVGEAHLVDSGRAVQFSPAPGFLGEAVIPYLASDGQATAASQITVLVRPADDEGGAPDTVDDSTSVNEGQVVYHDVLANDRDPDGDALALLAIGEPDRGGRARFRPDGQVVFTAPAEGSGVTGEVRVAYTVVDATGLTADGTLVIDVKAANTSSLPIARDDLAVAIVGDTVVVNVLANDSDANGDALSLVSLTPRGTGGGGATWTVDGDVTFTATEAGTFQFDYEVSDGTPDLGQGRLRIDVRESEGTNPPVAVRDDVVVVPGVPTVVDVLGNDLDLDGDVLVIQGIDGVPPGLTVEVVERGVLRITAAGLDGGVSVLSFSYTISDGPSTDTGLVVVRTVPPGGENQPPVLAEDNARVHAGGVATIPVLANDWDPDGDVLVLESADLREPEGAGLFVVQGDLLRFFAADDFDGTVSASYTAFDGVNRISQTVRIRVVPLSENEVPVPPDLEARTFTGQAVRIPLPLAAMDPDGDPVELLGLDPAAAPPRLGQVVEVGSDEIVYEPYDDDALVGTDILTYRVRDPFGGIGTGLIKVGIVPRSPENQSPVAVDDVVEVRPGRQVRLQPLLNDSDPDGDAIFLDADTILLPQAVDVEVDGNELVLVTPSDEGTLTLSYRLVDARQAESQFADVEIVVSETAAGQAPVAIDDPVEAQPAGATVTVDVLVNDLAPGGDPRLLLVTLPVAVGDATVLADGTVSFTMPDRPVSLPYTVADPDDPTLTSTAFVSVPLATNRPPVFVRQGEITTPYDTEIEIDLLAGATDPDGDDLSVVADSFQVVNGSGEVRLDGDRAVFDPDARFSGNGGFSYRITDGELETVAFALVVVEASGNVTPSFPTLRLTVPAGSEASYELDTPDIVVDPDDDTHTFGELDDSALPGTIEADLSSDGTLTLRSTDPGGRGQGGQLSLRVDDGKEEGTASGVVVVEVVASDQAPPSARPDELEVKQNETPQIDVLANDVDPFEADGGRQLVIVTAGPVAPASAGTVDVTDDGQRLVFTPSDDYDGTATVPYTIQDRTRDPERQSSSVVTLTIKGEPGAPGVPQGTPENRQVTLFWDPADPNGDPIIGYEVVDQSGQVRCAVSSTPSNSCTATGLTNGESYQFRVRAQNSVDFGPFSEPLSAASVPDVRPDAPAAPSTQFGDGQLTVTWTPPRNEGSALQLYRVQIVPGGDIRDVGPDTTTLVWDGLENGTAYAFRVQAENLTYPSEWSGESAFDVPAGIPLNVPAPNDPSGGDRVVTVTWAEPDTNGAAIERYEVQVVRDGAVVDTAVVNDPASRSFTVTDAVNGARYAFAVRAENKAGWSDWGPRSTETVPSGRPFGITNLSAAPTGTSNQVQLSFTAPGDNGAPITGYEVSVNGGAWQALAGNRLVGGLTNGTNHTFRVRACNINGCSNDPGNQATANPYGPPVAPTITSVNNGTSVTFNWSGTNYGSVANNGGRSLVRFDVWVNGAQQSWGLGTSITVGNGYGQSHTVQVRAVNNGEAGQRASSTASRTASTSPPPQPSISLTRGAPIQVSGLTGYWYSVSLANFPAGSTQTLVCHDSVDSNFFSETVVIGPTGTYSDSQLCYSADGPGHWVTAGSVRSNTVNWN